MSLPTQHITNKPPALILISHALHTRVSKNMTQLTPPSPMRRVSRRAIANARSRCRRRRCRRRSCARVQLQMNCVQSIIARARVHARARAREPRRSRVGGALCAADVSINREQRAAHSVCSHKTVENDWRACARAWQ